MQAIDKLSAALSAAGLMQAAEKRASAAGLGRTPSLDEVLRWLRELEATTPADLGPEWQQRGPLIFTWLRSPAMLRQLHASVGQVSNVATSMCAVACKLLLHLAASKDSCSSIIFSSSSSSSSSNSSTAAAALPVAAQLAPHLLTGQADLLMHTQDASPELAYMVHGATGLAGALAAGMKWKAAELLLLLQQQQQADAA
uniref:Uncharacterized protein n=1 Tax=Tetradesmus obliquus TaxID=3088 RepID=A0A383VQY8_TETOB